MRRFVLGTLDLTQGSKRVGFVALIAAGGLLGVLCSIPFSYARHMRTSQDQLLWYAQRELRLAEGAAAETRGAMLAIRDDHLPFCSDLEMALMRRLVFNGFFLRDLGRTKDGLVYCSAVVGRFEKPFPAVIAPFHIRDDRANLTLGIAPNHTLAISSGITGIIVDCCDGVNAVMNLDLLPPLDQGPMHSLILAHDLSGTAVIDLAGPPQEVSGAQIFTDHPFAVGSTEYQPLCSSHYGVCVLVSEAVADMKPHRTADFFDMAALGALLGALSLAVIALFYNRQQSFERQVRRAVRKEEITCVYQPVVDLATGVIIGAETLARWTDSTGEPVSPKEFIEIAEQKGFVGQITRLVIRRTLEELRPILHEPDFCVSVNMAPSDLLDQDLFKFVDRCLVEYRVPAESLALELTERSTTGEEEACKGVATLRRAGHPVYLDDFGTGYSSLVYLHRLHVDAIKLDQAFTRTVGTEAVTASVVPQILNMASELHLSVIVEGIETAEQAQYFRHAHYDGIRGQGWWFGMPMPAEQFIASFQISRSRAETSAHVAG